MNDIKEKKVIKKRPTSASVAFTKWVAEKMEEWGCTQKELGDRIGLASATICRLKSGKQRLSGDLRTSLMYITEGEIPEHLWPEFLNEKGEIISEELRLPE